MLNWPNLASSLALLLLFSCTAGRSHDYQFSSASVAASAGADRFIDHGVPVPLSQLRGAVATVDSQGSPIILAFLRDHEGTGSILVINALTGSSEQIPTPDGRHNSSPFAFLHSTKNRVYSHFNSSFYEFDAGARQFRFFQNVDQPFAMSMTEGPDGMIWAASYPNSHVLRYDPESLKLTDYGSVNEESWRQYPRTITVDETGWVYVGIGITAGQIVAFNPETGERREMIADDMRRHGTAEVFRSMDGKIYGQASPEGPWFELSSGTFRKRAKPRANRVKMRKGDHQTVFTEFSDDYRLTKFDVGQKRAEVRDLRTGQIYRISFDYESAGARLASLIEGDDGEVLGSSALPLRVFTYNLQSNELVYHPLRGGHVNAADRVGDTIYLGVYSRGILYEYTPSLPWSSVANPREILRAAPLINRPHAVLAHPNGRNVVFGGTPGYGLTGGAMVIYDRLSGDTVTVRDDELTPNQSIRALAALEHDRVVVGTTTSPGSGGKRIAQQAQLYVYDLRSRKILFKDAVIPGAKAITGLVTGPNQLVFGLADATLFIFDPARQELVLRTATDEFGGASGLQGDNALIQGPDGQIYALFIDAIVRIDPETFRVSRLADPPVPVHSGITIVGGRLFFTSGSHLWSFLLPN